MGDNDGFFAMISRLLPCLILLLLAACVSMTPEQRANACRSTDWQRFGLNDGKLGVPASARATAFDDCAAAGRPADREAYRSGRAQGLAQYCTVENGYRAGRAGRRYHRVCPPDVEPDFLQGFDRGRKEAPRYAVYPRFGIGIGVGRYWGRQPGPYTPPYWCGFWFPNCY